MTETALKADVSAKAAMTAPKVFLTIGEAAELFCISKSTLYKLTCKKEIPFYRPFGAKVYFDRAEIEAWMRRGRVSTDAELNQKAVSYCRKGGAR